MGRFDSLKSKNDEKNISNNPFKRGGDSRGKKPQIKRDFGNKRGDMPLPGLEEKKSKTYVAPGLRRRSVVKETTDKKLFETDKKFREKEGDFPELAVEKENTIISRSVPPPQTTNNWANIVTEKEKAPEPPPPPKEPVKPGWIRLTMDKKTKKIIREVGPTTEQHLEFMQRLEYQKERQIKRDLEKRMKEYEEECAWRYPNEQYINGWEWDDHVHHQEWLRKLAEDDGHFDIDDSSEEEEYYDDY